MRQSVCTTTRRPTEVEDSRSRAALRKASIHSAPEAVAAKSNRSECGVGYSSPGATAMGKVVAVEGRAMLLRERQ